MGINVNCVIFLVPIAVFYVNIFVPLMNNENFLVLCAIIDRLTKTIWINTSKMFIIISRLQQVPPIISLLPIQFLLLQLPLFWVKKIIHFSLLFSTDLCYICL